MSAKGFVPQIWAATVLRELENNLVAKQICNMAYEGEIKQKGDTVWFNGLSDVDVKTYSGSVSYDELGNAQVGLLIDQEDYFAFKVKDIEKAQANVDLRRSQAARAGYKMANAVDEYILGLYAGAEAGTVTDATCDTATIFSDIGLAKQYLAENNVPMNDMNLVIPPWVQLKLELAGIVFSVNDGLKTGKGGVAFAEALGFKIYVSNNVVDLGTYNSQCIACSSDAIVFAQQITETEDIRLENSFDTGVRGLGTYGAKVVKPKEMVRLNLTYNAESAI